MNGYFLANFDSYNSVDFANWNLGLGASFFLFGFISNQISDTLLINLRRPGETDYKIPFGFLFKYVSCPNHFSEIIQWTGFALMAWNCAALSFLIWTLANLMPRAIKHHRWYKSHFEDYPKNRKAIIPGLL